MKSLNYAHVRRNREKFSVLKNFVKNFTSLLNFSQADIVNFLTISSVKILTIPRPGLVKFLTIPLKN